MTEVDDLKVARAEIEKRGWYQGWLTDGKGVCAVAAVNIACIGSVSPRRHPTDWTRRDAACDELKKYLPDSYREISEFNDASTTTKQDVLNLFDKALADPPAPAVPLSPEPHRVFRNRL